MTQSKLFLSSCDRRELTRRRHHSRLDAVAFRAHPLLLGAVIGISGVAAYLVGLGRL